MQNMWISVALIVAVIIVGIIAGKRLSTPGPQRRAVYFAFGTLAVLALWFFIFVAFFPAEWIVPFFTVACIIIPICVYMMVLRSGGKERAKVPSKRSFEIPKKDITVESAKAASTVSSGTASASSATTPSKAATPAPSASQQTAPASSTPTSAAKTDTSSAPATKAKAPATAAVATAPTKPATSEAPKATAKPSAEAPKPTQPASKAEAPSTQKSTTESAPVAAPASTKPVEPAKSTEPQKAKPTKPTKQAAKPASHEAASKPFANKEHVAESAIEEATKKTPEPPVKAAPATTSPSEDQLREAAEIEILVDRAAQAVSHYIVMNASTNNAIALPFENAIAVGDTFITVQSYGSFVDANSPASKELVSDANKLVGVEVYSRTGNTLGTVTAFDFDPVFGAIKSITLDNGSEFKSDAFLFFAPDFVFVDDGSKSAADLRQAEDNASDAPAAAPASTPATQPAPAAQPAAPAANADGLSNEDALLVDFLIGKTLNDDVANADDTFALPKGTEITREIALDAKKHDALLLLTMSVD